MMSENMAIWDAVSKTNPANTKKVTQRGGFTSICAQSQIMEATRQFGPIGIGWGYEASEPIFHDCLLFVQVTLWHGERDNVFGPVTGGAEWKSDKGRLDSDAAKKATTDGLTKLLSQLGFNADVFLGLYDDSKYVAAVTREFAGQDNRLTEPSETLKQLRRTLSECTSSQECKTWLGAHRAATDMLDAPELAAIQQEYNSVKAHHDEAARLAA